MSQFIEGFFYLNNSPFSLEDYPHMRTIYDVDPLKLVLHTSRQVGKSSTLANLNLGRMVVLPQTAKAFRGGFKSLFVAPTVEQVRVFSHDRVWPVIEQTPIIKQHFINSSMIQNVFMRRLTNGSALYLRYGSTTPDRIRGISADQNCFDECQDIPNDNISIIEQTMSRSMYKRSLYAGTPKRTIGSLASQWDKSTQNEWMPKCEHCGKYNYLDEDNIAEWGLQCRYCKMELNPKLGTWVRTNDDATADRDTGAFISEGFRVSVLQFYKAPWVNWQTDVWLPFKQKPKGIFYNEYLGLAYDAGVAPITEAEIRACCTGGPMRKEPDPYTRSYPNIMGIDWGPINSENSRTVMSVMSKRGDITEVYYMKRFEGKEADYGFLHEYIPAEMQRWQIRFTGADAGFGESANSEIRKRINDPRRLIAFQHQGNQKQKANWNHHMQAYTLGRNKVITEFLQGIKQQKFIFPDWADFQPFAKDIMAIAIDYDEEKNKYKYINSNPDDALHSILYGNLAAELYVRAGSR